MIQVKCINKIRDKNNRIAYKQYRMGGYEMKYFLMHKNIIAASMEI